MQKTAYEMRISDWSSDVCSSDLLTQTVPMSFGELRLHADYAYVGRQSFAENTAADAQPDAVKEAYAIMNRLTSVRGYGLMNARATIALENPNLELSIWGRNLTPEKDYRSVVRREGKECVSTVIYRL